MSSRQRVLDVLNHRIPDRVPVYEVLIDPPTVEYVLGIHGKNSAMLEPEEVVSLHRKLGLDAVICGLKFFRPTALMAGRQAPVSEVPPPTQTEMDFYLERVDKIARLAHEEGMAAAAYNHGSFDVLYESLGFDNFMLLLYDDYDYVKEVRDHLFSYHLKNTRAALETAVDWMVVGDDVAFKTGIFISPEMFLDLWKEPEAEMVRAISASGRKTEFHTDGKLDFVLPHLIDIGVSLVNPVEPYSNDIRALKKQYGDQIALRGNVDIAGPLAFGTGDEVYEETKGLLLDLKGGGNYVCSTSHSVSNAVRPENYLRLVQAVNDYGWY